MTDIETVFDNVGTDLLDTTGRSATYTPSGGDAVSLNVFLDKGVEFQPALDAQAYQQGILIEALLDDLGHEPDRGDVFVISGTTYTVLTVLENDGQYVRVSVRE